MAVYLLRDTRNWKYYKTAGAGKILYTDNNLEAKPFKSRDLAFQYISNTIPSKIRDKFEIVQVNPDVKLMAPEIKHIQQESKVINDFYELAVIAKLKVEEYTKALSEVDMEAQDILHYLEFNSFNAAQGYKLSKILKDNRERRREIKDKLIEYKALVDVIDAEKLNILQQTNSTLSQRVYSNRIIKNNIYDQFKKK